MKKMHILLTLVVIVLSVTVSISWLIGSYFVDFALKRGTEEDPKAPPKAAAGIIEPHLQPPGKPHYHNNILTINMDNGQRTATAFYTNKHSDKWIVMVHGYCRDQRYVWDYAEEYLRLGYNVLTPDLNASGNSEGQYLTMGIKESKDVATWAQLLAAKNDKSRIVLHGVSMGAATVMLATQEKLPDNVFAVIEDCGYTSAYEMFGLQLERMFNLPQFPIIDMTNIVHKLRLGCYMSDAAPIKAIKNNKLPVLFIHGDCDLLVPVAMVDRLYAESGSAFKEKIVVKGATHASSIEVDKNRYFERVYGFIKKAEAL